MPGQKPPTMDDVWAPGKATTQTGDDYARDLGKGVMDGITGGITSIIGQTFSGLGKNGSANGAVDPIDALVQAEAKKKALREYLGLDGDGGRRRRRRDDDEDDDEDDDRPRRRRDGGDKAMIELIKFISDSQNKTIEKMDASTKEILREMREDIRQKGKGSDDPQRDILAGVGLQALQARATGDPVEEERVRRRAYFEDFEQTYGRGDGRKTPEDRKLDLEDKKLDLEDRRLTKQDEDAKNASKDRNKLLAGFLSAVAGRDPLAGDGQDAGVGQEPTQTQSRLYRYRCGACAKTFATVEPITHALCPHCGAEIGQGEGPPVSVRDAQQPPPDAQTPSADDSLPAAAMDDEVPY